MQEDIRQHRQPERGRLHVPQRPVSTPRPRTMHDVTRVPVSPPPPSVKKAPDTPSLPKTIVEPAPKPAKARRWDVKQAALVCAALLCVVVTSYVSVDTWLVNRTVESSPQATDQAVLGDGEATHSPEDEGRDETPPTTDTLANYTVEGSLPRALYIDKLGVAARILPMNIGTNNAIQAPLNIYDAGWYTGSVKPGEIGAAFIDGHASGPTREGLFAYLDELHVGEEVRVETGDGDMLTYRVVRREVVPLDKVDMKKVLLPYGKIVRGLNIMTCTGTWLEDENTYDERVIVYTEQITP